MKKDFACQVNISRISFSWSHFPQERKKVFHGKSPGPDAGIKHLVLLILLHPALRFDKKLSLWEIINVGHVYMKTLASSGTE